MCEYACVYVYVYVYVRQHAGTCLWEHRADLRAAQRQAHVPRLRLRDGVDGQPAGLVRGLRQRDGVRHRDLASCRR